MHKVNMRLIDLHGAHFHFLASLLLAHELMGILGVTLSYTLCNLSHSRRRMHWHEDSHHMLLLLTETVKPPNAQCEGVEA